MKKTLIMGVLGMVALTVSSYGQGAIALDSYSSAQNPLITFGGNPVDSTFTVGIYFAAGDVTGSVGADGTGTAIPSSLGGGLTLATGAGSTAPMVGGSGLFSQPTSFVIQNDLLAPGTFTLEIVAYNGADYASSTIRGHSTAFTIASGTPSAPTPVYVGDFMPAFNVAPVPEPSVLALAGLGLAALVAYRRKQA